MIVDPATAFGRAELSAAAGVDPWELASRLRSGDPARIEALAAAFYRAGGDVADAASTQRTAVQYVRDGYTVGGASPVDVNAETTRVAHRLTSTASTLPSVARLLARVADDLVHATAAAESHVRELDTTLARTTATLASFQRGAVRLLPADDRRAAAIGYLADAVRAVGAAGQSIEREVRQYEQCLAAALRAMGDLGYRPEALPLAGGRPTPLPAATLVPSQVAQWWADLSEGQRSWLLDHEYQRLGAMRGLPAAVLGQANRRRAVEHLAELERSVDSARGDERAALQARIAQDRSVLTELQSLGPYRPGRGFEPTLLLAYAPDGPAGQTGVELAYGDPDLAATTAVVVPGTGHSAADITSTGGVARALYDAMPAPDRAVVLWLDGPEPQSIPAATHPGYADLCAPRFAADLSGLKAAHAAAGTGPGLVTAVGHSYGSYIVGRGMVAGAPVDQAVFVGSPGVGVDHVQELGIDAARVWDGQTSDDPILGVDRWFAGTPVEGNNPSDAAFGGRHFGVAGAHGHSDYFQGESLQNIARIAAGRTDEVREVPAPDLHGIRSLPSDAGAAAFTPLTTLHGVTEEIIDGDLDDAVGRLGTGLEQEWNDVGDVSDDVEHSLASGARALWGLVS